MKIKVPGKRIVEPYIFADVEYWGIGIGIQFGEWWNICIVVGPLVFGLRVDWRFPSE